MMAPGEGTVQPTVNLRLENATARLDAQNPRLYIGRDNTVCGLVALHPSVSRRHAEVFLDSGQLYLRDLGSSNGTWVDGVAVGQQPVALVPGHTVYVGYMPLGVEWQGANGGATVMAVDVPAELRAMIEARKQQAMSQQSHVPGYSGQMPAQSGQMSAQMPGYSGQMSAQVPAQSGQMPAQSAGGGLPQHLVYRRQGTNQNGVLLIALPADSFTNETVIEGFVEFTAMDAERVDSITVELIELHEKGPRHGHVWDRFLVRQGPWKSTRGDVLPMPFQLRVPQGTSVSGRHVEWHVRGYVNIAWAYDIEAESPINMRNLDVEKIRDAMGSIDYRVADIASSPLGQHHVCVFQPPAQLQTQLGIREVVATMEYLGQNLKVELKVDKQKHFVKHPKQELLIDLARFRQTPEMRIGQDFLNSIQQMMG